MLIKITDKCTMGCIHCLSDCDEHGRHMTFDMFKKAIEFNNGLEVGVFIPMVISGGEPFEHPEIDKFIDYLLDVYDVFEKDERPAFIPMSSATIIATNGKYLSNHPEVAERVAKRTSRIKFQVVIDDRYYPYHVDETSLKKQPNVMVCHDVQSIYPQGRAITNNLPYNRKGSSCYNVRALSKQYGDTPYTLSMILMNTFMRGHIPCCPHIDIDGNIKLGESSLCPVCSNINKSHLDIANDIIRFHCHQCDFINKNLPPEYRKFVE